MHGSLETIGVEVDMCAPGWERIVDKSPPVDIIARDIIFGEGPVWDAKNKQLCLHRHHRRHDLEVEAGRRAGSRAEAVGQGERHLRSTSKTGWSSRAGAGAPCSASRRTARGRRSPTTGRARSSTARTTSSCKSDGSIWFTDPPGGMLNVGMVGPDLQRYLETQPVFRISPDGKDAHRSSPTTSSIRTGCASRPTRRSST